MTKLGEQRKEEIGKKIEKENYRVGIWCYAAREFSAEM